MPIYDYAVAGSGDLGSTTSNQWITGDMNVVTGPAPIAAGQVLDKYTVMARATDNTLVPLDTTQTDGRQLAVCVTMVPLNTTAAAATTPNGVALPANPNGAATMLTDVYIGGCFNPDLAVWPSTLPYVANSTSARGRQFDRTNIRFQRPL